MKKINSFLSVAQIDKHTYLGEIRNGRKTGEVVYRNLKNSKKLTFSEFFQYCIESYEIFICSNCNFEEFAKTFENNLKVSKADLKSFYREVTEVSEELEKVYGYKLNLFIRSFLTPNLHMCSKQFESYEEKFWFVIDEMDKRLGGKQS